MARERVGVRRGSRIAGIAGLALSSAALGWPARADDTAADPAATQALVAQLEQDAAHRSMTSDALARAKEALERAKRLRDTGDEAHAKAADALAREWAQAARDVVVAAAAEAKAEEVRRKAVEAQARLERERALVEASVARLGRLKAELQAAEREGAERQAVEVHDGDPAKPKKKPASKSGARP